MALCALNYSYAHAGIHKFKQKVPHTRTRTHTLTHARTFTPQLTSGLRLFFACFHALTQALVAAGADIDARDANGQVLLPLKICAVTVMREQNSTRLLRFGLCAYAILPFLLPSYSSTINRTSILSNPTASNRIVFCLHASPRCTSHPKRTRTVSSST